MGIEQHLGVITELQAGSYIFMDYQYRMVGGRVERCTRTSRWP